MSDSVDFDATVRLTILNEFLSAYTPSVERVAAELGEEWPVVAAAFERLAASRAIVLAPGTGELLMAAPFAAKPTSFRVQAGGRAYYANCVWDVLGVSAMLAGAGRPADITVETTCADCGEPLALEVRAGKVSATPPDAVVHFAVPAARWWADIVFT
jgi:hypothetical protein